MTDHYGDSARLDDASHEASYLHVTQWPGAPVRELPVRIAEGALFEEGEHSGFVFWATTDDVRPLRPELAFRGLLALDDADPDAVMEFANTHGELSRRFTGDLLGYPFGDLAVEYPTVGPPTAPATPVRNHILDVALYLRLAKTIAEHWIAHTEGRPVGEPWWRTMGVFRGASGGLEGVRSVAWQYFESAINAGIEEYRARVEVAYPPDHHRWRSPRPDLFSGLCLQVFNVMAESLPPRKCANERCPNYFIRQLGGAKHEEYRTEGVRFCTPSCAHAQAQREYRRRKKGDDR